MNEKRWKDPDQEYASDIGAEAEVPAASANDTFAARADETFKVSPTWTAPYEKEQQSAVRRIESQEPFSYDPESDPTYRQYRDTYTRMGEKARDDTIGVLRSRGGGQVSSYAGIAAQQAEEAYMRELADKVPQLRQLAYDMWLNEGDRARSDLQMYDALNSSDAARWGATVLDPFLRDRSYGFEQRQYQDGRADADWEKRFRERAYQDGRDDTMWSRGYQERAYQDGRDDALWSRDYQERAYQDGRDDALWSRDYQKRAYQDTRNAATQEQGTTDAPSGEATPPSAPKAPVEQDMGGLSYSELLSRISHINPGVTAAQMNALYNEIDRALDAGSITQTQYTELGKRLGYK